VNNLNALFCHPETQFRQNLSRAGNQGNNLSTQTVACLTRKYTYIRMLTPDNSRTFQISKTLLLAPSIPVKLQDQTYGNQSFHGTQYCLAWMPSTSTRQKAYLQHITQKSAICLYMCICVRMHAWCMSDIAHMILVSMYVCRYWYRLFICDLSPLDLSPLSSIKGGF